MLLWITLLVDCVIIAKVYCVYVMCVYSPGFYLFECFLGPLYAQCMQDILL